MKSEELKKLSIKVMIGSLIGSAVVAVIAVLVGDWNDTFGKALFTLLVVALHSLVSLAFLESNEKLENPHEVKFFTNTVFAIIVLSFFTAIFGIWEILTGDVVGKLYMSYFIFVFASLHGQFLQQTTGEDSKIDRLVYSNYVLMGVVILMLLPIVWFSDMNFEGFYLRLLAASAIVDATLTILVVILHKLYLQKHPKVTSQLFTQTIIKSDANGNVVEEKIANQPAPRRRMHPLLIVLIILLVLEFIGPLFFLFLGFW